jgi:hypothetical protein
MIQQIRKTIKKSKGVKKSKTSKRSRNLSKKVMRGGSSGGRYVLPPAYFGGTSCGYFPEGSSELKTQAHSVSQGVMWANGEYAGPNLYPSMGGGGCGCNGDRKYKNKSKGKKSKGKKSKSKSKSSRR